MAKKILVVDDEPDLLRVATFRLKKAGYEVFFAVDGQQALDSTKEYKPDLILLDLLLPDISGEEVCKRIKADVELERIPVIIFTAITDKIDEKSKSCGADDYLIKPFAIEELLGKIKRFTE